MLSVYFLAVVACIIQLEVGAATTSSITQQKRDVLAVALLTDEAESTNDLAKTRDLVLPTTTSHQKLARRGSAAQNATGVPPINPPAQSQLTRRSPAVSRISVMIDIGDDSTESDSTTPDDGEDTSTDCSDMDEGTLEPLIKRDLPPAVEPLMSASKSPQPMAAIPTKRDLPAPLAAMVNSLVNGNKTATPSATPLTKRDLPAPLAAMVNSLVNGNKTATPTATPLTKRDLPAPLAAMVNSLMNANKTATPTATPITKRDLPAPLAAMVNSLMNPNKTATPTATPITKRDLPAPLSAMVNSLTNANNKPASVTRRHLVL